MKRTSRKLAQRTLAIAVAACFASSVHALPVAPVVVNGSAAFDQAGNVLTVTNSNGAIINWQSFSIAAGETTHFQQASAASRVLNNVVGVNGVTQMSQLYGTLSSNGQVWLFNSAGLQVGASGVIDTAGFVASTLPVRPEDFLAGKLDFQSFAGAGDVVNKGEIRTPSGGFVYLVGSNVSNEGVITTPGGETILAAGTTVSLVDTGTPGVKVEITGAANNATNLGQIVAEAGRIGIAGTIVKNSGTLDASSVVSEGGRVFLKASQDTYVDGNGRIVATGTKGGRVEVLGNRVAVMDNAQIDASGTTGGGTILVGGDYQGANPDVQNAWITYFGPNASLKANATDFGNGGKVIVWADDTTRAFGSIEAKGGPNSGNGGFVETSGKRYLDVNGIKVNTQGGTWLLDPTDFDVSSNWVTLVSNLYANGSIEVSASNDIIFTSGTYSTSGYGGSLYFSAGHNISLSNAVLTDGYNENAVWEFYAGNDITSNSSNIIGKQIYMYAGNNLAMYGGYLSASSTDWAAIGLAAGSDISLTNNAQVSASGSGGASGDIFMVAGIGGGAKSSVDKLDDDSNTDGVALLQSLFSGASGNIKIDGGAWVRTYGTDSFLGMIANKIVLGSSSTQGRVIGEQVYVIFPTLTSGGVEIDGIAMTTGLGSNNSGFVRPDGEGYAPLTLNNGLYIYYLGSATVTNGILNEINGSTETPDTEPTDLPLPPSSTDPGFQTSGDESSGGGEDEFGDSSTDSSGKPTDKSKTAKKKLGQCSRGG